MAEDIFLERAQYTGIIEKRIRDLKDGYRQNLAIIGDELVGKTALIFSFMNKFFDSRVVILYLEIRTEDVQSFAGRFIGVLLYNFLSNSGIPLKEDLNFLIEKSAQYIPRTIEKMKSILSAINKRKKNDIFTELLSLCDIFNEETGKFCVVIFDEFQNLENIGFKDLYAEWSKLLIVQKKTMYVIVSSFKFKTKTILSKELSLLFGNFEILNMEPFDMPLSEYYIHHKLGALNLNTGLKNFILHFTGGYPFYLKVITDELIKANRDNLAEIIEDLFFDSCGMLNQRFSNYSKRFLDSPYSQDYISILYLASCGHNKLKGLTHLLHRPKKELDLRIAHLMELDIVSRSGDFLKINDRVFNFWLRFVYQEKLRSLTFDAKNQKIQFRDTIENMIQEFLIYSQKPIIERMAELLRLFEDDVIQIEKKRVKLTHFREIKPFEFNNNSLKYGLIGRSSEALWIMAFEQQPLTEDDIAVFSKECKKYHHKLQKKIIVSFRDMDANARLRALEEKIWTWDLNNLNQILDLFSRPRVIA